MPRPQASKIEQSREGNAYLPKLLQFAAYDHAHWSTWTARWVCVAGLWSLRHRNWLQAQRQVKLKKRSGRELSFRSLLAAFQPRIHFFLTLLSSFYFFPRILKRLYPVWFNFQYTVATLAWHIPSGNVLTMRLGTQPRCRTLRVSDAQGLIPSKNLQTKQFRPEDTWKITVHYF